MGLEAHIAIEAAENVRHGMDPLSAEEAARRKLGNATLIREEIYRMNTVLVVEELWQDLRHGARLLQANLSSTAVAVISVALGIGANTAIFQLLDAVRMRMLPVKNPQELGVVALKNTRGIWGRRVSRYPVASYPLWEQIRANQQAFSSVAAWSNESFDLSPSGESRITQGGIWVTGEFFEMLGVQPVLGRLFTSAEDRPGCGAVAGETGVVSPAGRTTTSFIAPKRLTEPAIATASAALPNLSPATFGASLRISARDTRVPLDAVALRVPTGCRA